MNKKPQSIRSSTQPQNSAYRNSTILRLVQRGALHTTRPELVDGHWTRRIFWDKSFRAERARRLTAPEAPRRKHIPAAIDPHDPSPIQTVTPPAEPQPAMLERAENAMNICLNAQRECQDIKGSITAYQHEVDNWAMEKVRTIKASELTCTRCTAILAAACILQLLLAAYYTLCHFNVL